MARAKEYDRERVLQKAVTVFWRKGYEGTSVSDLVKATGLNTFSMYREFGNKEGLFHAVLRSYHHHVQLMAVRRLMEEPGIDALRDFLGAMPPIMAAKDYTGCLYVNTLAEKEVVDKGAVRRVKEWCITLIDLLEASIEAAQAKGKISRGKDAAALANYLLCVVQGLTIYGRVVKNRKMTEKVIATALSVLEG